MKLFTFVNFKKVVVELYNTLSNHTSRLSSKRIERLVFTLVSVSLIMGCFIYLWLHKQLTASETILLVTPLLIAGGYNLNKGQQEKKDAQN